MKATRRSTMAGSDRLPPDGCLPSDKWFPSNGGVPSDSRAPSDDERLRALMHRAFGGLDAPDDISERMIDMIRNEERTERSAAGAGAGRIAREGWTHRLPARAAAAALAGAMLVGGGAYAAVQTDFFQSAFGDKGQEDVEMHEVLDEGKTIPYTLPSMTWVEADPAEAERIVGDYVEEVGQTLETNGYTLTVEDCLVDENGLGVATHTLANPDGVGGYDAGYGAFCMGPDDAVGQPGLEGATPRREIEDGWTLGTSYDYHDIKDESLSTATEAHVVRYFASSLGATDENGLDWSLPAQGSGGYAEEHIVFKPTKELPATEFVAASGEALSISPIGLVAPFDESGGEGALYPDRLVVRFTDGSEYVVFDNGPDAQELIYNVVFGFYLGGDTDHGIAYLFNRLVDVDAIESVVCSTPDGEVVFTPQA